MNTLALGERIGLIRRRRHLTQEQLALMITVAPSEIHRLESGATKDPHASRIMALAQALGVTTDWLLGLESD